MRAEGVTLVFKPAAVPGVDHPFDFDASPRWEALFSRPEASIYRLRPEPSLDRHDETTPDEGGTAR